MTPLHYLDFELELERRDGAYQAQVTNSPAGEAVSTFTLPFSEQALADFLARLGAAQQQREPLPAGVVRDFGKALFEAIFKGEVLSCLRSSVMTAEQRQAGLRLRLHLGDVPELVDVPWEFLFDATRNQFLVLSQETPVVRHLPVPYPTAPLTLQPPLRVLVVIASPSDLPSFNVEQEWKILHEALQGLAQQQLIAVERLEMATLAALQQRLRTGVYHVFHFIGHGVYDDANQDGALLFEDEQCQARLVTGMTWERCSMTIACCSWLY